MNSACARCDHPVAEHAPAGPCINGWWLCYDGRALQQKGACQCPKFEDSKLRWWWKLLTNPRLRLAVSREKARRDRAAREKEAP